MAVLTANKATKRFGGLIAVDELDLEIKEYSIHSIIGPNGAGKTTFFNCVTGFYRPEAGEILFNSHSLVGLLPDKIARLGISRTYQNIRLFPNLTTIENVLVGLHSHLKTGYLGIVLKLPATQKEEKKAAEEARRRPNYETRTGKGESLAKNLP
jgi:branched-chain amino acid transport system ATP-binding protein